jgi:DnaJ-class molecular chaperone
MNVLCRACEQIESDDDEQRDRSDPDGYKNKPRRVLRMRCYACAGTGMLEVVFHRFHRGDPGRSGRVVRCIACQGTGRVLIDP